MNLLMIGVYFDEFDVIHTSNVRRVTYERWFFLNSTCRFKKQEIYYVSSFCVMNTRKDFVTDNAMLNDETLTLKWLFLCMLR